jgi:ubiquinone/menaquinone biosynthesis C-methylase UbiE
MGVAGAALRHRSPERRYRLQIACRYESVTSLPYTDKIFDRVFSIAVLEHLDDDALRDGLREMAQVLKPGVSYGITLTKPD